MPLASQGKIFRKFFKALHTVHWREKGVETGELKSRILQFGVVKTMYY